MPDYRRYRVPGGTYFFTINMLERRTDLLVRHIEALRQAVRCTRVERPFHIDAWVVLPDHLHCVLTLPREDDDFSNRIKAIKIRFGRAVEPKERRSAVRVARGEQGIWQRRFWEHAIRDEADYARHMDYVHYNPVKHGHVRSLHNGRIRRFTVGCRRVSTQPTGAAMVLPTLPLANALDMRRNARKGLPPYTT